jgi:hypothetical protein
MIGELDAGNPHVQFDEGAQETYYSVTRLCPTLQDSPDKYVPFVPPRFAYSAHLSFRSFVGHMSPPSTSA